MKGDTMQSNLLLSQKILDFTEMKNTLSLDEQFYQLKKIIYMMKETEDLEGLMQLLKKQLPSYISGSYSLEILKIVTDLEDLYIQKSNKNLAPLYSIFGHIFFMLREYENAMTYYKKAISYGIEYKDYTTVSIGMNNMVEIRIGNYTNEIGIEIAKSLALFEKSRKDYSMVEVISRLLLSINFTLNSGEIETAEKMIDNISSSGYLQNETREYMQFNYYKAQVHFINGQYMQYIIILQQILKFCVKSKQNNDLLELVYSKILEINQFLNDNKNLKSVEKEYEKFQFFIKNEKRQVNKYLQHKEVSKNHKDEVNIGIPKKCFIQEGNKFLAKTDGAGHTLVLVDALLHDHNPQLLNEILVEINNQMQNVFSHLIIVNTNIDSSTLAYILPLSEEDVDELCKLVFEQVREKYPKDDSILNAIYFASVNNREHDYTTYENCLNLAYAYIYYELYK